MITPFRPFIVPSASPLRVADVVSAPSGREAIVVGHAGDGRVNLRYTDDGDSVALLPKYLTLVRLGPNHGGQ